MRIGSVWPEGLSNDSTAPKIIVYCWSTDVRKVQVGAR